MRALVSGVASDIGMGAARILKAWGCFSQVYGMDIHSDHPGKFVLDECVVGPRAAEKIYLDWLANFIADNKINLFIPTSEAEIKLIAELGIDSLDGVPFLINNPLTIKKSLDKYDCMAHLGAHGIDVPINGITGVNNPEKFPVIVKPRSGQGSKGIAKVNDLGELKKSQCGLVWQEYLVPDDQEYTCPIYRSKRTGTRTLVIKRKLMGGLTGSGMVVKLVKIDQYLETIADSMQLEGAMNVQLRLTANGPLVFEINPRLSSTLVFRDKMGFSDLRWWVSDKLGLEHTEYIPPCEGTFFYRGSQEYISKNK